jgi:crossover junction endodeoxyribonuclease RusA
MTAPAVSLVTVVEFFAHGIPKPQGSKRAFVHPHTRRAVVVEAAGAALKDWRHDTKLTALSAMAGAPPVPADVGVVVRIGFVMPRPKSTPKTKPTPLATKKPDLDKLIRGVCDAMTGVVYTDDSQVVSFDVWKRIAEEGEPTGAEVTVERLAA